VLCTKEETTKKQMIIFPVGSTKFFFFFFFFSFSLFFFVYDDVGLTPCSPVSLCRLALSFVTALDHTLSNSLIKHVGRTTRTKVG